MLKAHKAADPGAARCLKQALLELSGRADGEVFQAKFSLKNAQLVIARECGFDCWADLKNHVEQNDGRVSTLEDKHPIAGLFELELVSVPAGSFLMGSKEGQGLECECPQREVYLDAFEIMKYPLTYAQYQTFIDACPDYKPHWVWQDDTLFAPDKANHPAIYISWTDAQECARWLTRESGREYRLPTEAEWEKAARGTDGRVFPWGDEFATNKCNTNKSGIGETTPVDAYPAGTSPYGAMDMVGNVWEYCADLFD